MGLYTLVNLEDFPDVNRKLSVPVSFDGGIPILQIHTTDSYYRFAVFGWIYYRSWHSDPSWTDLCFGVLIPRIRTM